MPVGPCPSACSPWATTDDLSDECAALPDIEEWLDVASDLLFELTGERWPGSCLDVIRPSTRRGCAWWIPAWGSRCSCSGSVACCKPPSLDLPLTPATGIEYVVVDGVTLVDGTDYRLDDYRTLVRLDGEGWPGCQDLTLPTTEDGTFEISYTYGIAPPIAGKRAAATLACELAKSDAGDDTCALPDRTSSVTRQGVTINMTDALDIIREGGTGITSVDLFIHTYNPNRLARSGSAWNPDLDMTVTRTP